MQYGVDRPHPAFIEQVLRDRGMRPPPLAALQAYTDSLDATAGVHAVDLINRVVRGVEGSGEMDQLLARVQEAAQARALQQPAELVAAANGGGAPQAAATAASSRGAQRQGQPRGAPAKPHRTGRAMEARKPLDPGLALLRQHSIHIYAKSAALTIELATLREDQDGEAPEYTLQVEGATGSAGRYNWRGKIIFQMTRRELPQLAAFLLGYAGAEVSFDNHGPGHEKKLELKAQGQLIYARLVASGHSPVALPVMGPDVFAWGELALVALHLNRPLVAAEAHLQLLRRLGQMAVAERTAE